MPSKLFDLAFTAGAAAFCAAVPLLMIAGHLHFAASFAEAQIPTVESHQAKRLPTHEQLNRRYDRLMAELVTR